MVEVIESQRSVQHVNFVLLHIPVFLCNHRIIGIEAEKLWAVLEKKNVYIIL